MTQQAAPSPEEVDHQSRELELRVTVVSTTVPATLAALRRAAELAFELGSQIRLLVPHVVPYPLPLDRPAVDLSFRTRHFRTMSLKGSIETSIEVCLCRDAQDAIIRILPAESLVLIGGKKRCWPTTEQRLTKKLRLAGHHALFVPQS